MLHEDRVGNICDAGDELEDLGEPIARKSCIKQTLREIRGDEEGTDANEGENSKTKTLIATVKAANFSVGNERIS